MRALVTGGCGFIGSHLVDMLLDQNWEVSILDRDGSPFYQIPDRVAFSRGELSNRGAVRDALKGVDVVFHLAWSGVHQSSNQDMRAHVEINLLPSISLFELCLNAGVKKVVFISSGGTVYGKAKGLPIREDHPTHPICAYGVTKLAAENYLRLYGHLYGLDYIILRPSVAYGERQDPKGIQGAVAVFMGKVLRGEPIVLWGDGSTVRDFFYVGDLARACLLAATTSAGSETYNIGGGIGITLNQLVDFVKSATYMSVEVRHEPGRPFDAPEIVLDISKTTRQLGWRPETSMAKGLGRTWEWIKSEGLTGYQDETVAHSFQRGPDGSNVNAQNLNARDIAVRLDANKFSITLFYAQDPDRRLLGRENIKLVHLPRRLGSAVVLFHMLNSYDAIFYMRPSRADSVYRWLRCRRHNGKIIVAPIENQLDTLDSGMFPKSIRHYYDETVAIANLVVANSPYVAETIQERYGIEVPVVFSGVDVDYFQKVASERPKDKKRLRVIFAGSFQERKHPELVLDAASQWPDVEFVLMGDGPLRGFLEKRVTDENLSNVSLMKTEEYSEYAKVLVTGDIFLFPSRSEGLPKVTLEAAASGIPIVTFDDYQTPSVINGVTGFQVKTFGEMIDRLRALIENVDLRLRMGVAGVEHSKKFDWGCIVKQWEQIFLDVLSSKT